MPLVASNVATRLVVFSLPVFLRPKLIVTVSAGSTTPLTQSSATRAKLFDTMIGAGGGESALMRLGPLGVPQPVQRSSPVAAGNLKGLFGQKLLPVVVSWKHEA